MTAPESTFDQQRYAEIVDAAIATDEIMAALTDPRLDLTDADLRAHALDDWNELADAAQEALDRSVGDQTRHQTERNRMLARLPGFRWRRAIAQRRQRAALAATMHDWESGMRDNVVLPALRTLINERLAPHLWATLRVTDAPGLDRVRDSRFVVETVSAKRFLVIAGQIRYGAIGVAGTRGVGKSTVIEYYLAAQRDLVSVFVPAPVQYNAREFVLHLYAELCQEVIRRYTPPNRDFVRGGTAVVTMRNAIWTALVVVADALVVGPTRLFDPRAWSVPQTAVGSVLSVVGVVMLLMTLTGVAMIAWRAQCVRRFLRLMAFLTDLPPLGVEQELLGQARARLKRIRFLQTRTAGWSGKLTIPNSEVEISRSVEHAEQPLTYPEIVHELRQFIGMVTARLAGNPAVIVAVDELDKIEDAEHAQAFVNEIKGIFGVNGAQFLVSVSEDALASFERRGLAVRDAFDSAFDEIIRIEPLDLTDTCTLLSSRVIGVTNLFSALAHCMSGGLPRDIIRTARSMRAAAGTAGGIESVCRNLIEADIQRKIQAFQQATGQLDGTPDTTTFIRTLRTLHADPAILLDTLPALRPETADKADFRQVRWQAATYAYHCATVLAVFTEDLTTDRFEAQRGDLDRLAAAKQELGAHPQLAWLLLDEFRATWRLPTAPVA